MGDLRYNDDDTVVTLSSNQKTLVNADLDTFGTGVVQHRTSQISANFSTPLAQLNVTSTTSGGGTATQNTSSLVLATSTAVTASAKVVTNADLDYKPGREIYFMCTGVFTSPTSAASNQRIGVYDANNGFWIGYNGTSFGIAVRNGGVDTFTAQASFNGDVLAGGSSSNFTRGGSPEALSPQMGNLYRIRFGWLGFAPIVFEVAAPDGGWVVMHTIRQPNSSATPSVQTPKLPLTFEVNKTASDATNLTLTVTCAEAGVVSNIGGQLSSVGTITALNGFVDIITTNLIAVNVDVTGTWTGTLVFEGTNGDGQWASVNAIGSNGLVVSSITANQVVICDVAAYTNFRVRASAAVTGTVTIAMSAASGIPWLGLGATRDGSGVPITSVVSADGNQRLAVDIGESGTFSTATSQNKTFSAVAESISAATGSTDNPIIMFTNPLGSGKTMYIQRITCGVITVNRAAVFEIYGNPTATSGGTAVTPRNNLISSATASVITVVTLPTATVPTGALRGYAVGQNTNGAVDDLMGAIQVPPNNKLLITCSPSANATLIEITIVWTEQ